ncbi:MAG: hypothetical protein EOP09_08060 [Proteobacteria bacterium]|nr:MAG: hypothetical protein EOP09_08060 [Pseudomonadota bacterium]
MKIIGAVGIVASALILVFMVGCETSYDRYERLEEGIRIEKVIEDLGRPLAYQELVAHSEYLFELKGSSKSPKLFGVSYPAYPPFRVIRVRNGVVIKKGDLALWSKGDPKRYLGENLEAIWRSVPVELPAPPELPFSPNAELKIDTGRKSTLPRHDHYDDPLEVDTPVELFKPKLDLEQRR